MPTLPLDMPTPSVTLPSYSQLFSGLAALGVALQNYQAVSLFLNSLAVGLSASRALNWSIQVMALVTGGLCSGMVNFWMNIELLEGFYARMTSKEDRQYTKLSVWEKVQYFAGIIVFVVTGVLFGLMAFTFSMEGPLALLSLMIGLFVAGIMTIQEVETWLSSYDEQAETSNEALTWGQTVGKWTGHMIALGNVLALSLLFTLSLTEGLMALNVAIVPALLIGFSVAFTFGSFTEYYFYNFYLASFCQNFSDKLTQMLSAPNVGFGVLCVSINAFVNGALAYSGVNMLAILLVAANIALPPLAVMTALAVVSAIFAASASLILGLDFWVRQNPTVLESKVEDIIETPKIKIKESAAKNPFSLFALNEAHVDPKEAENTHSYGFSCVA